MVGAEKKRGEQKQKKETPVQHASYVNRAKYSVAYLYKRESLYYRNDCFDAVPVAELPLNTIFLLVPPSQIS